MIGEQRLFEMSAHVSLEVQVLFKEDGCKVMYLSKFTLVLENADVARNGFFNDLVVRPMSITMSD